MFCWTDLASNYWEMKNMEEAIIQQMDSLRPLGCVQPALLLMYGKPVLRMFNGRVCHCCLSLKISIAVTSLIRDM